MVTRQGDVSLLNDAVAQELLRAKVPAHLAYVWPDGTPRVVPIGFHWTGAEVVLGTPPDAPKMRALRQNPMVALTIDTDTFPYKVLLLRGTATVDVVAGVVPEYALMCRHNLGEEAGRAWLEQIEAMLPAMGGMARVAVRPEWVGIIDFEQRFPSAIEKAMAVAQAAG